MGGPSSEHEVSLKSGKMVLENLDREKFEVLPIKIEKDGQWPLSLFNLKQKIDVAFIAMHGEYGEDGQIQGLLETFKIPYTGSDPIASSRAMDKEETMLILQNHGYRIPDFITVEKRDQSLFWKNPKNLRLPVVVKPTNGGSSVGVQIVKKPNELADALLQSFQYGDSSLIQEYVSGREITCGILEVNGCALSLVPTEIIPKENEFFDYRSKYDVGGSAEITPPNLPKEVIRKIQQIALGVHRILGCSGMSRTDMILGRDGKIYVLELNTIPGLTPTSLLPQQAEKTGFSFPQLLEIIIQSAKKYA